MNFPFKVSILSVFFIFTILPVLSNEKIIIDVNINVQPKEMYIDGRDIPMMKKVGVRQWIDQNETKMKVDYSKDAINALKQGDYDKVVDLCNEGFNYSKYVSKNTIADYYHYIGLAYLKNSYYEKSIQYFNIAIKEYDNNHIRNSNIYYERGLARFKINDYDGAKEDYNKALSLGLKVGIESLINGDETYNYIAEIKSVGQNKDFNILNYFITPDMSKYGKLAFINNNIKKGEFEDTLNFYKARLKNNNKTAEIYNNIGVYYLEKYDHPKAFENFSNAIKEDSNLIEAYFNLALLYYSTEEYNSAKENLDKYFNLLGNLTEKYIVYDYGTKINYTYSDINKYIDDMLKANIELKLQHYNIANDIYNKYKLSNFTNDFNNKYSLEYLPLLEGYSYRFINMRKYKKAINLLIDLQTADYHYKADEKNTYRGKYFYWVTPSDENYIDFSQAYEVVENAYIRSNIALLEYVMKKQDKAMDDIIKAKDLAFKFNNIELYKQIIKVYNLINDKN